MFDSTGIATPTTPATAAASVREIAPPAPVALELTNLDDRLGALEVTFSALNERLAPVLRDDSYDPTPEGATRPAPDGPDVDTRGEVLRRLERASRAVTALTRDVERLISRLEV